MDFARNENASSGTALVVSVAPTLLQEIRSALESEGLQVVALDSVGDLVARTRTRQPVLLVLDAQSLDTPSGDGSPILESLKASPYTGAVAVVAIVPATTEETAQLSWFRRGVDDCLVLPESPELLRERLRAVARRRRAPGETAAVLTAEGMTLDLRSRKVIVAEKPVALTRKEFDLLNMLMRKRGIVVYTTHLYHSVWGYGDSSPVDAHTVKVHISSLRGKLGGDLGRKIVNLPGLGYRFDG